VGVADVAACLVEKTAELPCRFGQEIGEELEHLLDDGEHESVCGAEGHALPLSRTPDMKKRPGGTGRGRNFEHQLRLYVYVMFSDLSRANVGVVVIALHAGDIEKPTRLLCRRYRKIDAPLCR
jgi:hypothetical protein